MDRYGAAGGSSKTSAPVLHQRDSRVFPSQALVNSMFPEGGPSDEPELDEAVGSTACDEGAAEEKECGYECKQECEAYLYEAEGAKVDDSLHPQQYVPEPGMTNA